jgi:GNAT superfamily N-acetyltransferase
MVELTSPRPPPIVLFRLLGFCDVHNLAAGGGLVSAGRWGIFVLYLDALMRRRGIGTLLLEAMTAQAQGHNATEQWVSVTGGIRKEYLSKGGSTNGILFE